MFRDPEEGGQVFARVAEEGFLVSVTLGLWQVRERGGINRADSCKGVEVRVCTYIKEKVCGPEWQDRMGRG